MSIKISGKGSRIFTIRQINCKSQKPAPATDRKGDFITTGKENIFRILLFIMTFAGINFFTYYFIGQEKYIYFWDYSHYWYKYQNVGTLLNSAPAKAFVALYQSIRHDDYNLLPIFFLTPYNFFLGPDRMSYILAISGLYLFPASVLLVFLTEKFLLLSQQKKTLATAFIPLFTLTLFPQVWPPIFLGYPDIAGVIVIYVIFFIWVGSPLEDKKVSTLIGIGVLLALLVMLRRWYAYWTVSFFIGVAAERSLSLLAKNPLKKKAFILSVKNFCIIGISASIFFFAVATPVAIRMLTTNYADLYSAYKTSTSITQLFLATIGYFGIFSSALFIVAMGHGLVQKKTRHFYLLLLLQLALIGALFTRTQDFNPHHYYLLIPTIAFTITVFAVNLFAKLKTLVARASFLLAFILVFALQFSIVFLPGVSSSFAFASLLFSAGRYYPLVRNDIGEIQKMLDVLRDSFKNEEDKAYVLSSSLVFNDDILKNACIDSHRPDVLCGKILNSSHVDKRDGFPINFLSAGYVVLGTPVQYHLSPADQRVIGILADDFIHSKGIALSYERLPREFILDDGVKVSIYKKVKPFNPSELTRLQETFLKFYPGREDIFTVPLQQ